MASLEEVRNARLEKLKLLADAGHEAYPIESNLTLTLADALEHFGDWEEAQKKLTLGGRVRGLRRQGALVFFDIDDGTARFQILAKKGDLPAKEFELLGETVDIGDFVAAAGTLFVTKKKEKTLLAESWQMLAKSLRPLPSEWHGLQDVEERFRRRYLDALMAPEVRERFLLRAKMVSLIRNFLEADGYVEIETPVLQPLPGGATARPFVTHHEALDTDLYLRVADELYLKRLLVAGFPKVYEIGRDFRNEGIDVTHNPEFTMLEFYAAYSTAAAQRAFVEKLFKTLVKTLHKKTTLTYGEAEINFAGDFAVISFNELLKKYTLINNPDDLSDKDLQLKVSQFGVAVEPSDSREKMLDNLYKKVCRPKLVQPTFVVDYPSNYLPLAKRLPKEPQLVDAFQLVVAGVELVKAFSELNDPQDQLARMSVQEELREKGDAEAQRLDTDFIEALEYGMPPAGGVGIGLDRLAMLLTNTHNIREVIFFPTLRPRDKTSE